MQHFQQILSLNFNSIIISFSFDSHPSLLCQLSDSVFITLYFHSIMAGQLIQIHFEFRIVRQKESAAYHDHTSLNKSHVQTCSFMPPQSFYSQHYTQDILYYFSRHGSILSNYDILYLKIYF